MKSSEHNWQYIGFYISGCYICGDVYIGTRISIDSALLSQAGHALCWSDSFIHPNINLLVINDPRLSRRTIPHS